MERFFLFCLLLILSICSHHANSSPILTQERDERILGGTNAPRITWVVAIRMQFGAITVPLCGGFIINTRWVGTSARCIEGQTVPNTVVAAGTNANTGGDVYRLERFVIHPDFNAATFVSDIALLRTDSPILFSTTVNSIHLATNNTFIGTGTVTTFGWGAISAGGNNPHTVLQQATFTAITNEVCLTRFPFVARRFITDRHICTQANTVATCPGDGGGPIVFNNAVVGIASWVEPCVAGQTNVNTRITSYVDWIWSYTRADE